MKTLASQGACFETTWPYDITQFTDQPSAPAYTEGTQHLILTYQHITDLNQMKSCLASGYPFVFGITVYDSFESDSVTATGVVPLPASTESVLGGHALLAVGYDDSTQTFIFRNSWGTSWGQAGYGTIPYAYLTNPNLASDFWYITKGQGE
jgi:C1A family cysteine protease